MSNILETTKKTIASEPKLQAGVEMLRVVKFFCLLETSKNKKQNPADNDVLSDLFK